MSTYTNSGNNGNQWPSTKKKFSSKAFSSKLFSSKPFLKSDNCLMSKAFSTSRTCPEVKNCLTSITRSNVADTFGKALTEMIQATERIAVQCQGTAC